MSRSLRLLLGLNELILLTYCYITTLLLDWVCDHKIDLKLQEVCYKRKLGPFLLSFTVLPLSHASTMTQSTKKPLARCTVLILDFLTSQVVKTCLLSLFLKITQLRVFRYSNVKQDSKRWGMTLCTTGIMKPILGQGSILIMRIQCAWSYMQLLPFNFYYSFKILVGSLDTVVLKIKCVKEHVAFLNHNGLWVPLPQPCVVKPRNFQSYVS